MKYVLEAKLGRPHLVCPNTGYAAWFLLPAGVACELGEQRLITGDTARFVRDTMHPELVERGGNNAYKVVLNWTGMVGYDVEARDIFVQLGRECIDVYRDTTICIPDVHPVARIGIKSAAAMLVVTGLKIRVVESLEEMLEAVPLTVDRRNLSGSSS